jgi:hypothetical protein
MTCFTTNKGSLAKEGISTTVPTTLARQLHIKQRARIPELGITLGTYQQALHNLSRAICKILLSILSDRVFPLMIPMAQIYLRPAITISLTPLSHIQWQTIKSRCSRLTASAVTLSSVIWRYLNLLASQRGNFHKFLTVPPLSPKISNS